MGANHLVSKDNSTLNTKQAEKKLNPNYPGLHLVIPLFHRNI
jgi:hypothetical protein